MGDVLLAFLSVSPIGSSPLQLGVVVGVGNGVCVFQYPQSDRALCNWSAAAWRKLRLTLSVSPIGSSPLQLPTRYGGTPVPISFSIPNRIEPSATAGYNELRTLCKESFSIPNRIEPSATEPAVIEVVGGGTAFSIPNRIEPSATHPVGLHWQW